LSPKIRLSAHITPCLSDSRAVKLKSANRANNLFYKRGVLTMKRALMLMLLLLPALACSQSQPATPTATAVATSTPIVVVLTPTALPEDFFVPIDIEEEMITNLYERAAPSVVHITAQVTTMSFFFGPMPSEGTGSGFVYDDQGHIVTNYHVIEGAKSLEV